MSYCHACIHKYRTVLYAHALTLAPFRRIARELVTARDAGRIVASWPQRSTTTLAHQSMRDNPSKKLIAVKKPDNVDIQRRDPKRSALAQEMRYLGDPLKLADNTVNLLKKGQDEKAAEIVRLASKGMSCTVSWNHMIDYEMSKGRITRAMATYNDVLFNRLSGKVYLLIRNR